MPMVHDEDGKELGEVPLTPTQLKALDNGTKVAVLWHTPQLLQHLLGVRSGSFMLHKVGERITTVAAHSVKEFLDLQATIRAAREPN